MASAYISTTKPIEMVRRAVINGVRAAGEVVEAEAKANLAGHQSSITGTRDLWSEQAGERNANRKPLIDSIESNASVGDESGCPIATVGVHPDNVWLANFLEFPRAQWFWGRNTGEQTQATPFLRPAIDASHGTAFSAVRESMRGELQ